MSATPAPTEKRPGAFRSLWLALKSWRTASVVLLSFASGMPLGLVWIAIPDWLRSIGVDIRVVGLITLAQAPWTFKFLWSPLMDRFSPGFWGRRRGWIALAQVALFFATLGLAGIGDDPEAAWVMGAFALAIAFASATQDIAYDAYTVDVLRQEEQGVASGAKIAVYRGAMFFAGAFAITFAGMYSWRFTAICLALLYVPMLVITWKAPEPEVAVVPPRTLKEAVWYPFLGFLSRHRALEILAFVFTYKFADNLAEGLKRPFLVDMGYDAVDRGVALGTIGLFAMVGGALLGGMLTTAWGLGHALWIFGFLQIFSNIGYVLVAESAVNRPLMYGAMGFETFTQGLGTGAFMALLLRMTQKRFSATQFALFSSMFGIPRLFGGPLAGFMVYGLGWTNFFWLSMAFGIPGLVLLYRFVPLGVREPHFKVRETALKEPLGGRGLAWRGVIGGVVGTLAGAGVVLLLGALSAYGDPDVTFVFRDSLYGLVVPEETTAWFTTIGVLVFGVICGLLTAAVAAARHGTGRELAEEDEETEAGAGAA
jgi:MFS transporter, PAT family, beta-lactamase induction signal transducer AmpG